MIKGDLAHLGATVHIVWASDRVNIASEGHCENNDVRDLQSALAHSLVAPSSTLVMSMTFTQLK